MEENFYRVLFNITCKCVCWILVLISDFYVPGLACCLGLDKTFAFFAQRDRLKGTTAFLGGIVTVLLGWPIVGMIIELYGFVALFGGFLPLVISFLRQVTSLCPSIHDIYLPPPPPPAPPFNVSGLSSYS